MTQFEIDVTSDTICPWCFIGKRKLESAIKQWKATPEGADDTFTIRWKPFLLRPDAPKIGINKQEAYSQMFGAERAKMMHERIRGIGAESGIAFKSGGRIGATETSHRLIQYAWRESPEAQDRVVEELFKGYMENEQDITNLKFLTEAADRAGLDKAAVEKYLKSDEGVKEVQEEAAIARMAGISGVPNFVINDTFEIGGSQDPVHFLSAFKRAKAVSEE